MLNSNVVEQFHPSIWMDIALARTGPIIDPEI